MYQSEVYICMRQFRYQFDSVNTYLTVYVCIWRGVSMYMTVGMAMYLYIYVNDSVFMIMAGHPCGPMYLCICVNVSTPMYITMHLCACQCTCKSMYMSVHLCTWQCICVPASVLLYIYVNVKYIYVHDRSSASVQKVPVLLCLTMVWDNVIHGYSSAIEHRPVAEDETFIVGCTP